MEEVMVEAVERLVKEVLVMVIEVMMFVMPSTVTDISQVKRE